MFKFIHAADLHLDSPLKGLERYDGAPVDEIQSATRRALQNLVELALKEQVDFVLIAGDIYDGDWKDHNTGLFFLSQMARLSEQRIPVVLISGNHDAANTMTKSLSLPSHVHVLSHKEPETATVPELARLGVAIHGRSFGKAAETENMVCDYPPKQPGAFNIGLLHTSLGGAEGHERYAPCTLDDLLQKDYDYWALGHVHNRRVVQENPPVIFSGNVQGRHIRETGAKGCYVVSVDDAHQCALRFEPLDVFRWEICTIDATDANETDEILARVSAELAKLTEQHPGFSLGVRVILTGACAAHDALLADPVRWTNEMRALAMTVSHGIWIEKVKFQTTRPRAAAEALPTDGAIGELRAYLDELNADDEQLLRIAKELDDLKGRLPNELVQGEDKLAFDDVDALRRILTEIEPLLLNRLAGEMKP